MCDFEVSGTARVIDVITKSGPWLVALVALIVNPIITRKITRGQIVSGKRQDWINELRDLLSEFRAIMGKYHLHLRGIKIPGVEKLSESEIYEIYSRAGMLSFKIKLMLSPKNIKKPEYKELLDLVDIIMGMFGNGKLAGGDEDENNKIESGFTRLMQLSQTILKREWTRVKNME